VPARAVAVIRAWHDALNARDTDALVALADDDVELGGPRGSVRGASQLREWVTRQQTGARLTISPVRWFGRGDTFVVAQRAEWRDAGTGDLVDGQDVASMFVVRDGRVAHFARHPNLDGALGAAGIDERDALAG
jgi:ketosteroid isomerase-like protein